MKGVAWASLLVLGVAACHPVPKSTQPPSADDIAEGAMPAGQGSATATGIAGDGIP